MSFRVVILLTLFALFDRIESHHQSNDVVFYVRSINRWAARQLAEEHGLRYVSEVFPGSSFHHAVIRAELLDPTYRVLKMSTDPRVDWVERQTYQPRELRFISTTGNQQGLIKQPIPQTKTNDGIEFNDPLYPLQWYLHGRNGDDFHHLNVTPVWRQGLTGQGVTVAVLDDNVNPTNPEIRRNYDPEISGDVGARSGPGIKKNPIHGTYCAAVIAAEANNSFCGVGVAFNARIGGVRLLAKKTVLDIQEAKALNYKLDKIDIYSASWGPPDDGKHLGGPGRLSYHALERGVKLGRKGLGAIYVWASGNGGSKGDNCAYDSYASSIYTLTVSSLTANGNSPYYAEPCPAALTSLYVGGQHQKPETFKDIRYTFNVVVPEGEAGCQNQFEGTSAAAPLATGIIALLLEANPRLTWRDVQHLVVLNSSPSNDNKTSWPTNGAGLASNVLYGFGALNAGRLIAMGRGWKSVPTQTQLSFSCLPGPSKALKSNQANDLTIDVKDSAITYLEYVSLRIHIDVQPRGALSVTLQSPSGMISALLAPRPNDQSVDGLRNWNLTSAQFWGENPTGRWWISFSHYGCCVRTVLHSCSLNLFGF